MTAFGSISHFMRVLRMTGKFLQVDRLSPDVLKASIAYKLAVLVGCDNCVVNLMMLSKCNFIDSTKLFSGS